MTEKRNLKKWIFISGCGGLLVSALIMLVWQLWTQKPQLQHIVRLDRTAVASQQKHQQLLVLGAKIVKTTQKYTFYGVDSQLRKHPLVKQLKLVTTRYKPIAEIIAPELTNSSKLVDELHKRKPAYDVERLQVSTRHYTIVMGTFSHQQKAYQERERLLNAIPKVQIIIKKLERSDIPHWQLYSQEISSRIQKDKIVAQLRRYGVAPYVRERIEK